MDVEFSTEAICGVEGYKDNTNFFAGDVKVYQENLVLAHRCRILE